MFIKVAVCGDDNPYYVNADMIIQIVQEQNSTLLMLVGNGTISVNHKATELAEYIHLLSKKLNNNNNRRASHG